MNLKELKKMIAEEYSAYTQKVKEQDMPGMDDMMGGDPMDMGAPKIDVGPDDIKVGEDMNPEKILKDMFDMLKDFFEGDDKPAAPKAPKAPKADDKKDDDKEKDDKKKEMNESIRKNRFKKTLAENRLKSRFKKLANIRK